MSETLQKFRLLTENRQRAIKLRAEGTTVDAISVELKTPPRTLQEWFLDQNTEELEEYKAFLADKQIKASELLADAIQADARAAWDKLKSIAMSDDPSLPAHVSLAAVDSMLDRAGIARVSKTEGKHSVTMTDDDRRKRFDEIRALQSDLEPVQLLRLAGTKGVSTT